MIIIGRSSERGYFAPRDMVDNNQTRQDFGETFISDYRHTKCSRLSGYTLIIEIDIDTRTIGQSARFNGIRSNEEGIDSFRVARRVLRR